MKKCCGPGYATPIDAFRFGSKEKLLYVPCVVPSRDRPDYLVTIDVDPDSENFSKVIHRLKMPFVGDELHHSGWNACSSCYDDPSRSRNRLILPGLLSSRVYIIDVDTNPLQPSIDKVIEASELYKLKCASPHTTHCLPDGNIMISCLSSGPELNARGDFVLINSKTFTVSGTYAHSEDDVAPFGYDYWYQPYHNVMISTEWGQMNRIVKGFHMDDVTAGSYGTHLNVYDWNQRKLIQRIDLGIEGVMPLEIRFLHNPRASEGFVGSALFGNVFRFYKKDDGSWDAHKVIDIPSKKVDGWAMPDMPPVLTDILLSLDDKYLYVSNWVHGDIRQYNIEDTKHPKLTGQIFLGGSITKEFGAKVVDDPELKEQPAARYIKGKRVYGSTQMLQLSLDGRRLYVTTSLFSHWDQQFYPDMVKNGSMLLRVDVDHENGGMTLDENFLVDFGEEPEGAVLAHEIRFPSGDCTSDIYLTSTEAMSQIEKD